MTSLIIVVLDKRIYLEPIILFKFVHYGKIGVKLHHFRKRTLKDHRIS